MNGHTEMPTLTFGENCTYDVLDSILNGNKNTGFEKNGVSYGWAVRIWIQGVIITGLWGWTDGAYDGEGNWTDYTSLLVWDVKENDYCIDVSVPTDDITRLEIL